MITAAASAARLAMANDRPSPDQAYPAYNAPARRRFRTGWHTAPALTLLAMAEAALDEMDGRRMEAAEGRRVHQLRDQQYAEMIGQLPEQ